MHDLEFWTDAAITAIMIQGYTPKGALFLVVNTEEFKETGISKDDLWESILKEMEKR